MIKIADICDSLINGQENCVSWIQSEDSVNSQTEELVETLEGLQSELRIYKDLLMENTGHAPAMKSIVDSMRPDIERMSNESYGMSYTGVLPKHGEQICRCLGGQWETMGELCDLLDKLAPLQKTNRQVEPATASQDDAAADPEESMATFHVFIASENQGVKNAPERTDRSLQPNKNCQGPKSVSSATEVLEMPHDVFVKITNSCEALLQEQRKCVQLWRSEINPDYETEVLIGALEDFQAELKLYRDLITKDLNRTNATSSALTNMSKELERLLTLADQLTRIGFLPISGGAIVSSLDSQRHTLGELVGQFPIHADVRPTHLPAEQDNTSGEINIAVIQGRAIETNSLGVNSEDKETDPEEATTTFNVVIASENAEVESGPDKNWGLHSGDTISDEPHIPLRFGVKV